MSHFNPRSREGSDLPSSISLAAIAISIHAPVKGATGDPWSPLSAAGYFNPRSREGSDEAPASSVGPNGHFNPRSREGSDTRRIYDKYQVFQSTLP